MKKVKKFIVSLCLVLVFLLSGNLITVEASSSIGITDEFDDLESDARYLGSEYRDNYYLDLEKTGILDTGEALLNGMANILFFFIRFLAFLTVAIFYYAMGFDIAGMFAPYIGEIQETLKEGIFEPLFMLAMCGTFFIVIMKFWKRDMTGIVVEFGKVILVAVLAILVVKDSATAMSYVTGITKGVSVSIINGVTYGIDSSGEDYAAEAAGILWINLIHEPWKTLEFGYDIPDNDVIAGFLALNSGDPARKELVEEYENETVFAKERGAERIGFCLAYLIPFLGKCAIYILASLIQIVFQLVAILYLFLAPLVLLLALIPGYEMNIITIWLKKMLNTQISILTVSFVLALLVKVDKILYDLNPVLGWFPVLLFQTVCGIGLFLYREEIIHMVNRMQKTVQNPAQMKRWMEQSGQPLDMIDRREQQEQRIMRSQVYAGGYDGYGEYGSYGGFGGYNGYRYNGYEEEPEENYSARPTTDMTPKPVEGNKGDEQKIVADRGNRPVSNSNFTMSSQEIYDIFNDSPRPMSYAAGDADQDPEVIRPMSYTAGDADQDPEAIRPMSYAAGDADQDPEVIRPMSYAAGDADQDPEAIRPMSYTAGDADQDPEVIRPMSYAAGDADQDPEAIRPMSYAAGDTDQDPEAIRPMSYAAGDTDQDPEVIRPMSYAAGDTDQDPEVIRPMSYVAGDADQDPEVIWPLSYEADWNQEVDWPVSYAADQEPEARESRPVSYAADQEPEARGSRPVSYAADQEPEARGSRPVSYAADREPEARGSRPVSYAADQEPEARRSKTGT